MKIQNLKIAGFLSYQEEVEIDFTQFSLACITGENGSGKSSILDAITWALFGKARQSNESLINLQSDEAIVSFSFEYGGESYKIHRSNKRGKPARLTLKTPELDLTERTIRDTQNKIEEILKIDYETFIHAVFFLQGESDQFVTASSGQRKQVLFDILGLAAWEDYRLRATTKIKQLEILMEQSRGSMQVLEEDIRGEGDLKVKLVNAITEVKIVDHNKTMAQKSLDEEQKVLDEFITWKEGQEELRESFAGATERAADLTNRRTLLLDQQAENQALTSRKSQIVKDYARSQELILLLEDQQHKQLECSKLLSDLSIAEMKGQEMAADLAKIPDLEKNIKVWEAEAAKEEELLDKREQEQTTTIKLNTEINNLRGKRVDLNAQIEGLEGHEVCPLCEQDLKDPLELIGKLDKQRDNIYSDIRVMVSKLDDSNLKIKNFDIELVKVSGSAALIVPAQDKIYSAWHADEDFDHGKIEKIREQINLLSYDPEEASQLKQESTALRYASEDHGLLIGAEKVGDSLTVQIQGLDKDLESAIEAQSEASTELELSKDKYTGDYEAGRLAAIKLYTENLENARAAYDLEVKKEGQIEAQLQNIEKQKVRLKEIRANEKENTDLHQKYSVLQEAFSKKGVPALLVEQALPQIESKANQLLDRLSGGQMAVHFITQRAYSDSSREDMKETLDIQIQDQAGIRDYEMYSGGESFRINFAIRIALSHVLANRAGAKLRTLVIDEGFGSQDAGGRDRLINAINEIKEEYSKVLVITHLPEVIESFPTQIRVEKTSSGSQVRIL